VHEAGLKPETVPWAKAPVLQSGVSLLTPIALDLRLIWVEQDF
jgi:hypothetical protein